MQSEITRIKQIFQIVQYFKEVIFTQRHLQIYGLILLVLSDLILF